MVAILQREPERRRFIEVLEGADSRRMSVASLVEISIVIESRFGSEGLRDLDAFLAKANFELLPVDREQSYLAREAFSRFGKGRASLNYGYCFSYALARSLGEPLLCKGNDFVYTDVMTAVAGTDLIFNPMPGLNS